MLTHLAEDLFEESCTVSGGSRRSVFKDLSHFACQVLKLHN